MKFYHRVRCVIDTELCGDTRASVCQASAFLVFIPLGETRTGIPLGADVISQCALAAAVKAGRWPPRRGRLDGDRGARAKIAGRGPDVAAATIVTAGRDA